jgi:stage II sporulation protein D
LPHREKYGFALIYACAVLVSASTAVLTTASAHASEQIRVVLAENVKDVEFRSSTGASLDGEDGPLGRDAVFSSAYSMPTPVRITAPSAFVKFRGRSYRGAVEVRKKRNGGFLVVNELDLEDYLRGVVGSEVPRDWEPDALRAQAVAARTYALYRKGLSGGRAYHIQATVDGQVYHGVNGESRTTDLAVADTKGLVLTYGGAVIPAFFHSSCGGHTENAELTWGIDEPYLKGVDCDCQELLKTELWEVRLRVPAIEAALRRKGYGLSGISEMSIDGITPAGRVRKVAFRCRRGTQSVSAETLRAAFGGLVLPSAFFELEMSNGEAVFSGRGKGHGVGLCQWGAQTMALRGRSFREILAYYYPGTRLVSRKK